MYDSVEVNGLDSQLRRVVADKPKLERLLADGVPRVQRSE